MAVYPVSDIITWAKISQYLGEVDLAQQSAFRGGNLDPQYPILIRMDRRALEFMNGFDSNNANIDYVANYVYNLCGKYLAEAKVIAGQGGSGGIVNPSTGTATTLLDISLEFELEVTASPVIVNGINVTLPNDGDNSITLPLENIIQGSLLLTIGGTPQPSIVTTNSTYTSISYTSSQATIVLGPSGTTFQNGNTYIISGIQLSS